MFSGRSMSAVKTSPTTPLKVIERIERASLDGLFEYPVGCFLFLDV